jgi:hypothetical protein
VHFGNDFVAAGTILPSTDPRTAGPSFEDYEFPSYQPPEGEDELDALRAQAEAAGVKVDKRWGAERIHEAIDAATK